MECILLAILAAPNQLQILIPCCGQVSGTFNIYSYRREDIVNIALSH